MPSLLTIHMVGDGDKWHGASMASLLQGVLMERIDPAYASLLHRSSIHPYSQYVEEREGRILWHVQALTDQAEAEILGPLRDAAFAEAVLEQRRETLRIVERELESCPYEKLIEDYYLGNCSHVLSLRIRTPMGFKQAGRYCIFPSTRLIFQSLMLRFDACSPDSSIFTPELLEEFETMAEIVDYRLRSVRFYLEGVRIPSFMGDMQIRIRGPRQMANVAWMLARFGEFSGIGIKTGMGMGAVLAEGRDAKARSSS